MRVYAYTCPRARVNTVSGPFFEEGGLRAPSQKLSLCAYNMPTVSTISGPGLLVVHSIYRLYSGKRACALCLQTMHRVYVYAQCLQVSTGYTYKHIRVYEVYTKCIRIRVYMYTRIRAYACISARLAGAQTAPATSYPPPKLSPTHTLSLTDKDMHEMASLRLPLNPKAKPCLHPPCHSLCGPICMQDHPSHL